jgi:hypothetical protein
MAEKQREMDRIQAQYEVELAQLGELQQQFIKLELDYNRIMEERKREVWPWGRWGTQAVVSVTDWRLCSGRNGKRPKRRCSA